MKRPTLKADKRELLGKKVKQLRRDGFLPANIYGKDMPSLAIQVKTSDFIEIRKEAGETGVINVEVDGTKYPSLMKNIQMNYNIQAPLHVDFHKVNLKEKIKAVVPIVLNGEAPAVVDKLGMLLQTLSDVEVEALPDNLPENVELSIEGLTELGASITVGDIKAPEDVVILTDAGQVVAKIAEIVVEPEPEPEVAEGEEGAEAAAGKEKAEGESEEGKKEEAPAEEKKEE